KDVAPGAVAQVHAHRSQLAQDGKWPVFGGALEQFTANAQRVVDDMPGAEHPLVAADGTHTFADLIRERLEGEAVIGGSQSARDGIIRPFLLLRFQEGRDGFGKSALEKIFVAV